MAVMLARMPFAGIFRAAHLGGRIAISIFLAEFPFSAKA
jgi:hypothetical protein